MKQNERFDSGIKFEDLAIGQEYLFARVNTISTVTNLSSNSVELFNRTDRKNCYKSGQKDANGEVQTIGRRRGIDGKNWYEMDMFNRTFKTIN